MTIIISNDYESPETIKITSKLAEVEEYLLNYDFKNLSIADLEHYCNILKDFKAIKSSNNMGKLFGELMEK